MKRHFTIYLLGLLSCFLFTMCISTPEEYLETIDRPHIFPDYTDITIPPNIAPLNFHILENQSLCRVIIKNDNKAIVVKGKQGITIPLWEWERLLAESQGKQLTITVCVKKEKEKEWIKYQPFYWQVAKEEIDPYLVYRLIEPTYANWNEMGIFQRCLENFEESAIIQNNMTDGNCMNCHAFCQQNESKMVFHMRKTNGGTYLINNGEIVKLNTTTPYTPSFFVYPAWHPLGEVVAFTVNKTHQSFYMADNKRSEIYDSASDIICYDIAKNEIFTNPLLSSENVLETYPFFSPDGRKLFFCTAPVEKNIPENVDHIKYSLCSIDFDPDTQQFGQQVDTLVSSSAINKSVVFPRISPDGKYLICSVLDFGCFPCWSREADLYAYAFDRREFYSLEAANSPSSEGYNTWSSNSRWLIVSSRRLDNGFSRPFISYINKEGIATKAFLLPQKDPAIYTHSLKSYNLPELIKNKVSVNAYKIKAAATGEKILQINVRGKEKITGQKEQTNINESQVN